MLSRTGDNLDATIEILPRTFPLETLLAPSPSTSLPSFPSVSVVTPNYTIQRSIDARRRFCEDPHRPVSISPCRWSMETIQRTLDRFTDITSILRLFDQRSPVSNRNVKEKSRLVLESTPNLSLRPSLNLSSTRSSSFLSSRFFDHVARFCSRLLRPFGGAQSRVLAPKR